MDLNEMMARHDALAKHRLLMSRAVGEHMALYLDIYRDDQPLLTIMARPDEEPRSLMINIGALFQPNAVVLTHDSYQYTGDSDFDAFLKESGARTLVEAFDRGHPDVKECLMVTAASAAHGGLFTLSPYVTFGDRGVVFDDQIVVTEGTGVVPSSMRYLLGANPPRIHPDSFLAQAAPGMGSMLSALVYTDSGIREPFEHDSNWIMSGSGAISAPWGDTDVYSTRDQTSLLDVLMSESERIERLAAKAR